MSIRIVYYKIWLLFHCEILVSLVVCHCFNSLHGIVVRNGDNFSPPITCVINVWSGGILFTCWIMDKRETIHQNCLLGFDNSLRFLLPEKVYFLYTPFGYNHMQLIYLNIEFFVYPVTPLLAFTKCEIVGTTGKSLHMIIDV